MSNFVISCCTTVDLTKEHLYAYIFLNDRTGATATEETVINTFYLNMNGYDYNKEYKSATQTHKNKDIFLSIFE